MGTEVIAGSSAADSSLLVEASGVFAANGTLRMPIGDPRTFTFHFTGGDLVVLNATGPTSGPVHLDNATCAYSQSWNGSFRVLSGDSTGSYAGATGHGSYVFSAGGIAPKKADGKCGAAGAEIPGNVLGVSLRGPVLLNPAP
jgi:hypothetical protein